MRISGLNPSSCTMALGSTQPLTEMSTRNLPGGKWLLVHEADNLTTICEFFLKEFSVDTQFSST
jgi:hypothetical protein